MRRNIMECAQLYLNFLQTKQKNKYGLCLKKGKQLLCPRKNLRVITPFTLNENFWFSFSFLSNEITVEKNTLVFKASPYDQFRVEKTVIDNIFHETCRLMLPILKGWLKQADVLRHLVIYLDRSLAEFWMKSRPNEESLADSQYELLPHLLFGCHGNSIGTDYVQKWDKNIDIFTTILWNKDGHLGCLEKETASRLDMHQNTVFAFAQQKVKELAVASGFAIQTYDIDLSSYQQLKDNGMLYEVRLADCDLPILPGITLYFPKLLTTNLPDLGEPEFIYVSIVDNDRVHVFKDVYSCCFAQSKETEFKSPIFRMKRENYQETEFTLSGWELLGKAWDWPDELLITLPPNAPRGSQPTAV